MLYQGCIAALTSRGTVIHYLKIWKIKPMIHVIATIYIENKMMGEALKIYKTFTPLVNKEKGCLMYLPTLDHKTDIQTQKIEDSVITVIEKWENLERFKDHLVAPHVIRFRKRMKSIIKKVSVKILKNISNTTI